MDQAVDEETLDIFSEINSNNLVSTNTCLVISGQSAEVQNDTGKTGSRKSQLVSKIAERQLIRNKCEFARVQKLMRQ